MCSVAVAAETDKCMARGRHLQVSQGTVDSEPALPLAARMEVCNDGMGIELRDDTDKHILLRRCPVTLACLQERSLPCCTFV